MKLLVISNDCVPFKGADSICLREILLELCKDFDIHIVSIGEREGEFAQSGIRITGVKKSKIGNFISSKNSLVKKGFRYLFTPDLSLLSREQLLRKVIELASENRYSALLTTSGSFLPQLIGIEVKKLFPFIKWIAHFNDPFPVDSPVFKRSLNMYYNPRSGIEEVLSKADFVTFNKVLYNYYSINESKYKDKMMIIDIPLVKNYNIFYENNKNNLFDYSKINLVYSGSFYRRVRSPKYLFRLMRILDKDKFILHLVGDVGSKNLRAKYKLKENLVIHGLLERDNALEYINSADILISLGNYQSFLIPGKIFEYMGTGLPIVHFAKIDNDPAATYLLDYNNSLVIDEKERLENSAANFIEFCIINKRKRIKYDVVGETFKKNTSKYNARIIKNFIYSI